MASNCKQTHVSGIRRTQQSAHIHTALSCTQTLKCKLHCFVVHLPPHDHFAIHSLFSVCFEIPHYSHTRWPQADVCDQNHVKRSQPPIFTQTLSFINTIAAMSIFSGAIFFVVRLIPFLSLFLSFSLALSLLSFFTHK